MLIWIIYFFLYGLGPTFTNVVMLKLKVCKTNTKIKNIFSISVIIEINPIYKGLLLLIATNAINNCQSIINADPQKLTSINCVC